LLGVTLIYITKYFRFKYLPFGKAAALEYRELSEKDMKISASSPLNEADVEEEKDEIDRDTNRSCFVLDHCDPGNRSRTVGWS
jgi:hypothetical protein